VVGVAVVGTGFGQRVHIPGFKAHPQTEIIAVYHRDLTKAREIARAHNIPHAYNTIAEIVKLKEVQAVSISTPPFLHYEMAKTVLQAEKHLLLEKPVALNVKEAKEIQYLAQKNGVIATVDFEFRFVPEWQLFSELLSSNYVGNRHLIRIDWLSSSRTNQERPWNWYSCQDMGGGVLGSLGSHTFDYIHWLFGPVRRINAHLTTAILQRPDNTTGKLQPVSTDDTCILMLELSDGTPCQINVSAVVHAQRTHWLEVYGDKGTLVLGSENQKDYIHGFRIWGSQAGQALTEIKVPNQLVFPENHYDGRISAFIRVVDAWLKGIETGKQTVPSLQEGVYSQLLIDLSKYSNTISKWIDVPDLKNISSLYSKMR